MVFSCASVEKKQFNETVSISETENTEKNYIIGMNNEEVDKITLTKTSVKIKEVSLTIYSSFYHTYAALNFLKKVHDEKIKISRII